MTNFETTLMRCHALGYIMGDKKGKTNLQKYEAALDQLKRWEIDYDGYKNKDTKTAINKLEGIGKLKAEIPELEKVKDDIVLSESCKTYLVQSYVLSKYGRVMEVKTKQMVKGTLSEEDSIELFSVLEKIPYSKNTERVKNDFISGTPDLFDGEDIRSCNEIIDVKSCWDIFTFLSNVREPENDMYYWQLQGYMALTGAKIGTIAYCLVNTPESIIEGEKYALLRKMDVVTEEDKSFQAEFAKLKANRYYDDIPMSERLLTYSIDRNDDDINSIYKRVAKCREFLSEFEEQHLKFSKTYRKRLFSSVT